MSEPIIFNNVDFEFSDQEVCSFLKYKGEPFTGKLLIAGDCTKGDEVIDYCDGKVHGHDLAYYPDGKPFADKTFDHGCCVAQKEWYSDGKPRKECNAGTEQLWDCDGVLAKENTRWLYKNGQPIEEQNQQCSSYFSSAGDLAAKKVHTEFGNGRCCYVLYYYDHILIKCFEDLFTNFYPELDEHFTRQQLLPDWLNAVYQEDDCLGHYLMDCLINHQTPQTRKTAILLKNNALHLEKFHKQTGELYSPRPDHIIVKLNFDTRF